MMRARWKTSILAIQTIYDFTSLFKLIFCLSQRDLCTPTELAIPALSSALMGFGMTTVLLNLHQRWAFSH